jgi:hypothetical protein
MTNDATPFEGDPADQRLSVRHLFRGEPFTLRIGKKEYALRLKDLSCGGACGLLDEPLAVGDYVMLDLHPGTKAEAEVRWVRRTWVGLRFSRLISPALVAALNEKFATAPDPARDAA